MADLGYAAILVAFIMAVYGAIASLASARTRLPELWTSARNAAYAAAALASLGAFALWYALISNDFSLKYVWEYSSSDLSNFYKISSFWAGLEGSLLLWAWLLSLFAAAVLFVNRNQNRDLMPYVTTVMMGMLAFFMGLTVFLSNPFEPLRDPTTGRLVTAIQGQGLNPLLQNRGMFFHPPTLYLGYVGFTVPFAFAMGALLSGRLSDQWIRSTRRWALVAWAFLSLGILIGMWWAYVELGWGGYWGWDPVENSSLMPWLVGTAYLHSSMIQQKRGMLKVWNLSLITTTYALVLFGTLVTRSGLLSSVHAFSGSNVGPPFLALIGVVIAGAALLLWWRWPQLQSENQLDSFVSREATFLLNNLLLVGAAFAVFWGTIFPIVSEALKGTRTVVGAPFFEQVVGPIFLAIIVLMGACTLVGWRKASWERLVRNFLYPLAGSLAVGVVLAIMGVGPLYALVGFWALAFVGFTLALEFYRGARARHHGRGENWAIALPRLVLANRPRYGGYVVHVGIIALSVGVLASIAYPTSAQQTLKVGDSMTVKGYTVTLQGVCGPLTDSSGSALQDSAGNIRTECSSNNNGTVTNTSGTAPARKTLVAYSADLAIAKDGSAAGTMKPAKSISTTTQESASEIGLRSRPMEDLYIVLMGWSNDFSSATIKVIVNPMVMWIWIGGGIALAGSVLALWPERRKRVGVVEAEEVAEVARGAQEAVHA